jgi:streptogramin lyase
MHTRPSTEKNMRVWTCLAALFMLFLLPGCGGSGSSTPTPTGPAANVNASINWAARSRALDAPASALSAVLILKSANPTGGDFTYTINRDPNPAAYTRSYTSPRQALRGTRELQVRFYSQPDGGGSVVGSIDATMTLGADGNGIGSFTTNNTIASVAVDPNQVVGVGQTKDLTFSARDASNALVAVTPGSATFAVTSGGSFLHLNTTQQAVGAAIGTAIVTVSVDGKTSAPQSVTVSYLPSVTVTPTTSTMLINGSQVISGSAAGAPTTAVNYSIQEGASGGTLIPSDNNTTIYVAPATPGTYHVVAASRFDTSQTTTATITVTAVTGNGSGIYVIDSANQRLSRMDDMSGTNWQAIGIRGAGVRQFNGPQGLYATADGHIYVADSSNNRIIRMDDMSGKNWTTFGAAGSGTGQFDSPYGVTVGPDNKIYVADTGNSRIVRLDDMTGANWTAYGSSGNGVGHFNADADITVASSGQIYVGDWGHSRIVRIDDMTGANWTEVDNFPSRSISVGVDGRIYGANFGSSITRVDDMSGANRVIFQGVGSSDASIVNARSVFTGTDGRIYIAGSRNPSNYAEGIVRVDDMVGTNWKAFGTNGVGIGQFSNSTGVFVR